LLIKSHFDYDAKNDDLIAKENTSFDVFFAEKSLNIGRLKPRTNHFRRKSRKLLLVK